ncbi:MAG: hypothetical protein WA021_03710 [Minisyncoccia bacterium]
MTNRITVSLVLLLAPFFAVLAPASYAVAQGVEGLQIKPAVIEDRADPGETYNFTVNVTNVSETERTFYLTAQDIRGLDDRGNPLFAEPGEGTPYELSGWVSFPGASITLKGGESRNVPITVRVPREAAPGSHFGGVFFDIEPQQAESTGAAIALRVGSIIALRISGDTTEDARLREFSTEKRIYSTPNVGFNSRVENLGNVLLRPHGLIEITDMRGTNVATVRVNDTGAPIFPETDRVFTTSWNHDGFAFGRYQAIVSLVYGEDERKTITGTTAFWVLPLKPILTVLGTFLGIALVLYLYIRMYIRRKLGEMGGNRSNADYYERRYQRSASRMMLVTAAIFVIAVVFLALLFVMFA